MIGGDDGNGELGNVGDGTNDGIIGGGGSIGAVSVQSWHALQEPKVHRFDSSAGWMAHHDWHRGSSGASGFGAGNGANGDGAYGGDGAGGADGSLVHSSQLPQASKAHLCNIGAGCDVHQASQALLIGASGGALGSVVGGDGSPGSGRCDCGCCGGGRCGGRLGGTGMQRVHPLQAWKSQRWERAEGCVAHQSRH